MKRAERRGALDARQALAYEAQLNQQMLAQHQSHPQGLLQSQSYGLAPSPLYHQSSHYAASRKRGREREREREQPRPAPPPSRGSMADVMNPAPPTPEKKEDKAQA